MNEGENLISAIRSDSLGEADSEMGVLQFASEGRGKTVMYSWCIASSGVPYLSDASTRLF
jgi:hypothetical protein